jgi:hypothetical protein
MGFNLRQAFNAIGGALCAAAAAEQLSAHNPAVAIVCALAAGVSIISAGITTNQPR